MLYVVAWPVLAEADDTALRRLRVNYHPQEASLIGPHFTLVFGAPASGERALRDRLAAVSARPFWFVLDRVARHDSPVTVRPRRSWLYAMPGEGDAALRGLHEQVASDAGEEPFEPHMTLGVFERAAEGEQVARIVERQHLPIHGRVEELSLLARTDGGLEELARRELAR